MLSHFLLKKSVLADNLTGNKINGGIFRDSGSRLRPAPVSVSEDKLDHSSGSG
jgi:hypothetical protein